MRLGAALQPHRATTAHVGAIYPWMAEAGLGSRGVYIGLDLHGGAFVYDPWELYQRELDGPNMIVAGELGKGKSSFLKTYLYRQSCFGRRALALDPKGENGRLCQALGVEPVRLEPGGRSRLNPLDPRIAGGWAHSDRLRQEQLAVLIAIVGASLGRRLQPEEVTALELALRGAARRREEPALPDVVSDLFYPSAEAAGSVATTVERLAADGRPAALGLRRLCEGDLRGMFDGPTSVEIDFSAPLVSLDMSAVYLSEALGILMVCVAAWLQGAWARNDAVKRIVVIDEGWVILRDLQIARWLQSSWKLARAFGVQNIAVFHRFSDLTAGEMGSERVELARGLLSDTETQVIYSQPEAEIEEARELLQLSEAELREIRLLPRGTALWRVGQRRFVVRHQRSALECWITETGQRMATGSWPS